MAKTWKVSTSPRARFALANMLLHRNLTFKTRKQDRDLHRARESLGLIGLTETLLEYKRVNDAYASDSKTLHMFEVTEGVAELLTECREKVEVTGYDSMVLADLFTQLDAGEDGPNTGDAFHEILELPRWKPSNLPVFEGPGKFYDVLREALTSVGSYDEFAVFMVSALDPTPEVNGHDMPEATASE